MKTKTNALQSAGTPSGITLAFICIAMLIIAFKQSASSATFITWTGGGGDGYWSDAANWNPNTAIGVNTNDVLQFNGTTGLINTNDVAGDTNNGIVFQSAAGAFTLNPGAGGTTLLGGDINNQSTNLQTINQNLQITGGNRNIDAHSGSNNIGNVLINGVISQDTAGRALTFQPSPGSFQLSQGQGVDGGNATLTAANTYSGSTILGQQNTGNGAVPNVINGTGFGTLTLDFSAAGAPANNILYNGVGTPGQLTLNGGSTLLIKGAPGVNNTNNFGTLQYAIGLNTVQLVAGSGGTVTANFGTLNCPDANNNARAGAVNFVLGANTHLTMTKANNATTGILNNSGYAGANYVVNGTDWAANDGANNLVAYTAYGVDAVSTANANLDVQTSGNLLSAAVATIRFNQNVSMVLSNNSSYSLANAAILMTPNCGAHTNIITGTGSLGGIGGRGFMIFNFDANPNSELVLDFDLGNNNQGTAQTTFCGPGLTVLTQPSETGGSAQDGIISVIGGAKLLIYTNACLSPNVDGKSLQLDNGTLMVQTNMALDNNNGGGLNARLVALGSHGGSFDVSGSNMLTISGVVSGPTQGVGLSACSLTKLNTGTLVLSGANTYTGPTFVKGGTLVISHAPTGTGAAMVVNDGATLTDSGSVPISTANLILGSSTGCTNTFTGVNSTTTAPIATTTLNASGTTVINVTGVSSVGVYPLISFVTSTGTGNFVVGTLPLGVAANIVTNNGTNIALNVTSTGTPYVWKGNVNNNWNIGATANWFLNNSTVYSDGSLVRFDDTASLFNVNLAANVAPGGITVTNTLNAYTFSGTNNLGGSGSLNKTGTNNLIIAVNNYTASGGIVVNAGTLTVGDGNTNGAVTASAIVDNSAVVFNRADTNGTFSGGISGSGTVTVNANTNGIFVLGGNNSYLGNTIIQSGTVKVGSSAALPFAAGDGILVVNQAGVLNVNADLLTLNGLSGTGTVDNQTAFGDPNHNGLNFTVGANNTNSTFAGSLTNTIGLLNLNKTGNGTLSLTGTNYNTGMWIFGSGIVNAASFSDYSDAGTPNSGPCAVGNRPFSLESANNNNIGLWFEGGTLQYTGSTPQTTDRMIRLINGNAGAIDASGSNPGATLQFTWNDASLNFFYNGGTRTLRLTGSNTGVNVMSMHIYDQGASPTSILKDGAGTWYLTNSVVGQDPIGSLDNNGNSYTGTTTVSNGVLYVSTGSGDVAVASPVGNGAAGPALGTIGGSAYTVYDGATLGMINLDNTYRVRGQSLTNNGSTTLRFGNVDSTTLPVSYFTNVAMNGNTTIALDDTNNVVAGNTYPLIQYGTLSDYSSLTLAPLPAGIYGTLTNDTSNSWIALVTASTPFMNTTPTNITASVISNVGGGQSLVLSWPADHTGWTLQAQTNSLSKGLGTNWVNVPGSASVNIMTNPIVTTNGTVFYRMKL